MSERHRHCEYCDKPLPKGTKKTTDYYNSDVNSDYTLHWICEECNYERAMDV